MFVSIANIFDHIYNHLTSDLNFQIWRWSNRRATGRLARLMNERPARPNAVSFHNWQNFHKVDQILTSCTLGNIWVTWLVRFSKNLKFLLENKHCQWPLAMPEMLSLQPQIFLALKGEYLAQLISSSTLAMWTLHSLCSYLHLHQVDYCYNTTWM